MSIEGLVINAVSMPEGFADEARVVWWIASMQELLAWHKRAVLTGWSCKRRGDDWLLIVHINQPHQTATTSNKVTFCKASTMFGCFAYFARHLRNDALVWKDDQYPIT